MVGLKRIGVAVLAALVAACGGGGGGDDGDSKSNYLCTVLPGASGAGCTNCAQVTDTALAGDGNLYTAATMGPGGQGNLHVTGDRQKAGTVAGAYIYMPKDSSLTISFTTLLNGQPQEGGGYTVQSSGSQACGGTCLSHGPDEKFFGFVTSMDYNGIQATITNTGAPALSIHEICTRSDWRGT